MAITDSFLVDTLSIHLDDADNVALTVDGLGNLLINGADITGGPVAAVSVATIQLTATGSFDNIIDLSGINQTDVSLLLNISLDAGDGSDTYLLDQSGLLFAATVEVNDTGVVGSDALQLGSTSALGEVIGVSSASVSRSLSATVGYTGIESLEISGTAMADTINISGTAAGTATTVNALGGVDSFGAIALNTIGAAGLTIDAGGQGEDLSLNLGAAGVVAISATSVTYDATATVNYAGFDELNVNGTVAADTFNVLSTGAGVATTVTGAGGTDIFGAIALTTIDAAGLTINAGGNGESLTLEATAAGTITISGTSVLRAGNGLVTYSGLAGLLVNGSAGSDSINISSTAAATVTTVNGLGGVDVFGAITLSTIGVAGLTVNGGGQGEFLVTNLGASGIVDLTGTTITYNAAAVLNYSSFDQLDINGTAGADTFNVLATASGVATTINASGGVDVFGAISLDTIGVAGLNLSAGGQGEDLVLNLGTTGAVDLASFSVTYDAAVTISYFGFDKLDLNGTAGTDTFDVLSTGGAVATTINALGGVDIFGSIALTTIGAAGLTLNAGGQGESLTVNTTSAGTITLSGTTVLRAGSGLLTYSGLSTLIANGTAGIDTFNVLSTAAATATTINALGSADIFGAIALDTTGAAGLTVNAGGQGEDLVLNLGTAGEVDLTGTTVTYNAAAVVTYSGFDNLELNGTAGSDTFNVLSTGGTVVTTINALGGVDYFGSIALTTIGAAGLTLNAGGQWEPLTVRVASAGTTTISSTTVQRSGNGLLTYSGLATLIVNGTVGIDTFNVLSTAAATQTTVNSFGMTDVFGAIALDTIGAAGLALGAGQGEGLKLTLGAAGTVDVTGTTVTYNAAATITYIGFGKLDLDGTAGADTFNVLSTGAGVVTTINALDGVDLFGAIALDTIGAAGLTLNAGGEGEDLVLNLGTTGMVDLTGSTATYNASAAISYFGFDKLDINGTAGADTFNVLSTGAAVVTTINASGGVDVFGAVSLDTIGAAGLTLNAGDQGEDLVLNLGTAGTVDLTGTTATYNAMATVTYSGFDKLDVNGTAGVDTFNVLSTGTTVVTTINALAGMDLFGAISLDTIGAAGLTLNAGGQGEDLLLNLGTAGTVDLTGTTVTYNNTATVGYNGFDKLDLNGTAGADTLNVLSTGATVVTTINGSDGADIFGSIALDTIGAAGLTLDAGGQGEDLILNLGTPGTVDLTATTATYNAVAIVTYNGFDKLDLNGTAGADTFNVLSTGASVVTTINAFSGMDVFGAIDLNTIGAAGLTLDASGEGEDLTLNLGAAGTVDLTSSTVTYNSAATVAYFGFDKLDVNGTAAADTFNVLSTHASVVTTINAMGGIDTFGAISLDTIGAAGLTLNAGGQGEDLLLNLGTAGTVDLTGTTVTYNSIATVAYSGFDLLDLNGTAGADTINVLSTGAGVATTINTFGGVDLFGPIALDTIDAAGLALNAGGQGEDLVLNLGTTGTVDLTGTTVTYNASATVAYSGFDKLDLNGTAGVDTFNVLSTGAGVVTTIQALGGTDVFGAIDLTTIGAAGLTIHAGGQGESLTLNTTSAGTVTLTSASVQRGGNGSIAYSGLATLVVNGTAGADTFHILSTAATTATTVNALAGTDTFGAIALTTIGAAGLTVNAGGQGESITFESAVAGTVTLSNASVQRTGNGLVSYSGLATLILNGTAGADTFNVLSTHAATASTLNAGGGNDFIKIGDAGSLNGILGSLAIHGDAHSATPTSTLSCAGQSNTLAVGDRLHFDDSANLAGQTFALGVNSLQRSGAAIITFNTIETIVLDAGIGNDTINIHGTRNNISLDVFGRSGDDTIRLISTGTGANLRFDSGAQNDTINLRAIAAGTILRANSGSGDDTVNIMSSTSTLNDIAGSLVVNTGSGNDKLLMSDHGQSTKANDKVVVRNNRVQGFAGANNNVNIHYAYSGSLQLTLIGSNTFQDKFRVLLPSKPNLTMQFDGRGGPMDCVRIDGTNGHDEVRVGNFGSGKAYQLKNIECLHVYGKSGNDTIENAASVSSMLDGGDGNDLLIGGNAVDVIFGGNGVDELRGYGGNDYLFGDHEFNNRNPRVKSASNGDVIRGHAGVDTIVGIGSDTINAGGDTGDTIVGVGLRISSVDWLKARFLNPNGKNVQDAINKALAQPCTKH